MSARQSRWLSLLLAIIITFVGPDAQAQPGQSTSPWQTYDTANGERRSYARDIGGKKYSPLDQIDASNFALLEVAWEWETVDDVVSRSTPDGGEWFAPLATIVESLVGEPHALPARPATGSVAPARHALDGRWRPPFQYPALAGGRRRRHDR